MARLLLGTRGEALGGHRVRGAGQHPQGWPVEGIRPACLCPHSGADPSLCHCGAAEVPPPITACTPHPFF